MRRQVTLYERRLDNMRDAADKSDEVIARLNRELAQAVDTISSNFHQAPIGDLRNRLETDLVKQAEGKAETAFRLRSQAMVVVWRIDRMHNTYEVKNQDKCKCGESALRCAVLITLAPFTEGIDR